MISMRHSPSHGHQFDPQIPIWGPSESIVMRGNYDAERVDVHVKVPNFVAGVIDADRIASGHLTMTADTAQEKREELGQVLVAIGHDANVRLVERPDGRYVAPSAEEQCLILSNRIAGPAALLADRESRVYHLVDRMSDGAAWYSDDTGRVTAQHDLMQERGPLYRGMTDTELASASAAGSFRNAQAAKPLFQSPQEFLNFAIGEASLRMRGNEEHLTSRIHFTPNQRREIALVEKRTDDLREHVDELKSEARRSATLGMTAGPWRGSVANDDSFGVYAAGTLVSEHITNSHLAGKAETVGDVRLAIAAPDLYAGCRAALKALEDNNPDSRERAYDRLLRALRRAEGLDCDTRLINGP